MIRLSVNVITSAMMLLKRIEENYFSNVLALTYSQIFSISAESLFNFSSQCKWCELKDDLPTLTNRGKEIVSLLNNDLTQLTKREMLRDYILEIKPIWVFRIPYGRKEASVYMTKDEVACFMEAELLSDRIDSSIVKWWDMISEMIRADVKNNKLEIGRLGEEYSLKYEKERTKSEPMWISIDTNMAGYDIKSQTDSTCHTPLLIEVKASKENINHADFYLSSHEWLVAKTSTNYIFHLWSVYDERKMLAIVTPSELESFIPTNNLTGEWESVKIPFRSFADNFQLITQR